MMIIYLVFIRRNKMLNGFFIGMDIGGTHVRIVSCDEAGNEISAVKKVPFVKYGNAETEVVENLCKLIEAAICEKSMENKQLKGIGIALAALFSRKNGDITVWPNNKTWDGFPVKDYLTKRFNVPVLLEDDANSAALGEHFAGAGRGYDNFAYITVSTGIGCGLILNGSLYIGSTGWAGEIGHIKVVEDGPECSCGEKGCLQSVASGPALLRKFKGTQTFKDCSNAEALDLKEVARFAKMGLSDASGLFAEAGEHIGKMAASLVMVLDLQAIILGGGVMEAGDVLLESINTTLNVYLKSFKRDIKVIKSQMGDNNGPIGALNLIIRFADENKFIT
jgi:glucokinase